MIKIFLSHSSRDREVASAVVELLRAGLELPASSIRCTSVDGYKLPIGADTGKQLRDEILKADVFLSLLSESSLRSSYVLFELGARWGADLELAPLLIGGLGPSDLPSPIADKNAYSADAAADLHQMLANVAAKLRLQVKNASLVQRHVEAVQRAHSKVGTVAEEPAVTQSAPRAAFSSSREPGGSDINPTLTRSHVEDEVSAKAIIEQHCAARWPDDFRMRASCTKKQKAAYRELLRRRPEDIPAATFLQIRHACRKRWPDDFRMRLSCEGKQVAAWRELQSQEATDGL